MNHDNGHENYDKDDKQSDQGTVKALKINQFL